MRKKGEEKGWEKYIINRENRENRENRGVGVNRYKSMEGEHKRVDGMEENEGESKDRERTRGFCKTRMGA